MKTGDRKTAWPREVEPALESKIEEFRMLGLNRVTAEELWNYLKRKKWAKIEGELRRYQLVADILAVKPGEFISFQTVEAFREENVDLDLLR
ncbi:post-transcriptional regulator [Bacillus massilinigeriensis]|uniref:post-transcriptional regulator n=1 Tax=Bacillus mediterraneensis TaxID=1805474 RepID=UPI0008F8204C|nr:post-transcriptional regulator [Bacillus mediterraneensis]